VDLAARKAQPFLQAIAVGMTRWRSEARFRLQVRDILQHGCALGEPLAICKLEHRHRALGRYRAKVAVVLDQLLGPDVDEAVTRFDPGLHQRDAARQRTGHREEIELQHDPLRFHAPMRNHFSRAVDARRLSQSIAAIMQEYCSSWLQYCRRSPPVLAFAK
jgi:hypothetical protein